MTYSEPSDSGNSEPTNAAAAPTGGTTRAIGQDERASTAVVLAISDAAQADPMELSPPLHGFVDPDALDALVEGGVRRVAFDAYGYRVVVEEDVVEIRRPVPGPAPATNDGA